MDYINSHPELKAKVTTDYAHRFMTIFTLIQIAVTVTHRICGIKKNKGNQIDQSDYKDFRGFLKAGALGNLTGREDNFACLF